MAISLTSIGFTFLLFGGSMGSIKLRGLRVLSLSFLTPEGFDNKDRSQPVYTQILLNLTELVPC